MERLCFHLKARGLSEEGDRVVEVTGWRQDSEDARHTVFAQLD